MRRRDIAWHALESTYRNEDCMNNQGLIQDTQYILYSRGWVTKSINFIFRRIHFHLYCPKKHSFLVWIEFIHSFSVSMAQAIPFLKLAGLLVKTLAKPIAQRIKIEASRHPRFSVYCTSLGQAVHHISSRINILASGYKFFGVKPLPPEEGRVLRMCQYRLSTKFCAFSFEQRSQLPQ